MHSPPPDHVWRGMSFRPAAGCSNLLGLDGVAVSRARRGRRPHDLRLHRPRSSREASSRNKSAPEAAVRSVVSDSHRARRSAGPARRRRPGPRCFRFEPPRDGLSGGRGLRTRCGRRIFEGLGGSFGVSSAVSDARAGRWGASSSEVIARGQIPAGQANDDERPPDPGVIFALLRVCSRFRRLEIWRGAAAPLFQGPLPKALMLPKTPRRRSASQMAG